MNQSSDELQINAVSLEQVFTELSTTPGGLTTVEADQRLQTYGFSEIVEKKAHPWLKFFGFFWGIPWMIEIAAILAALSQHWETFFTIVAMLLLNAGMGFWQRQKADNAIELLKEKMALTARVQQDGA